MLKPLHVGRGVSLKPAGTDLPVIKDGNNRPYIPGSSVKGVLRSELERLLRALAANTGRINGERIWACDPFSNVCISAEKKNVLEEQSKENGKVNEGKFFERLWENTCTACRLFGSQWIASRVYIKDLDLKEDQLEIRTEIRDGVGIDRDTGTASPKAKFDFEVVPIGTKFFFEAVLENLSDWEVGLFALILQQWETGQIALGGNTSRGIGWSELKNIKIEKVDKENLLSYLLEGKRTLLNLDYFIGALKGALKLEGGANASS
jgi:CRISPR-associated RAMP protein (TIGR02581 family)